MTAAVIVAERPSRAPAGVERLPALTGYRFILAFLVMIFHVFCAAELYKTTSMAPSNNPTVITAPLALVAVSSFFVLSGFVLTWSTPIGASKRAFWRRRAAKILPNHLLTWAVTIAFLALATPRASSLGAGGLGAGKVITNLFLVQTWVPRVDYILGVNGVSWSISCEAFFYLAFPLLALAIRKLPERRLWMAFAVASALIITAPLPTLLISGSSAVPWLPMPVTRFWLLYAFPPVRALELTLGIVIARLVQTEQWPRVSLAKVVVLPVVVFCCVPFLPPEYLLGAALCVPMALIIPTLATNQRAGGPGRLGHPVMQRLGEASFALYMVHYPVIRIIRHLLGPDRRFDWWSGTLVGVGMMLVAQALALLVYQYFEAPLTRWLGARRTGLRAEPAM